MHDVRFDSRTRRVVFVAAGFWDKAELSAFMVEVRWVFEALGGSDRPVSILADLRALLPQSQQVFGDPGFLKTSALINVDRHAVVTASALLRMQFRRFFQGIPTEFFDDHDAAIAWLGWDASDQLLAEVTL